MPLIRNDPATDAAAHRCGHNYPIDTCPYEYCQARALAAALRNCTRPALEALLLSREPLSAAHVAAIRAYLRQWIMAPAWRGDGIAALRAQVDELTSRGAIDNWLAAAGELAIDPL